MSPKSRPVDQTVADRQRGKFAGDPHRKTLKHLKGSTAQPRGPPYDIEVDGYDCDTIPLFCKRVRISVAFYYKLKTQGKTPRELHLGNRRLISRESAEAWRREREAATAAEMEEAI